MCICSPETVERIRTLLLAGESQRSIAKQCQVDTKTVTRYRRKLQIQPVVCGCGLPSTHKGRCQYRRYQYAAKKPKPWWLLPPLTTSQNLP